MSTLRAGTIKSRCFAAKQSGFTLIEVMMVLLIVGLMAGITVMSMPPKELPIFAEGRALATRLEQTAQTSLIEQVPMGIKFAQTGYSVWVYKDGIWEDRMQYTYNMTPPPTLRLTLNGAIIDMKSTQFSKLPTLHYSSTGLATPFEISLESASETIALRGKPDGSVRLNLSGGVHE